MFGALNFHGNVKYFVLEFAEYGIDEYLHLPPFPGKLTLTEIMFQMLDAIKEVHECGLTHQDIKPENFRIHNNVVRILDFGLVADLFNEQGIHKT